jgi:hypothetical protein
MRRTVISCQARTAGSRGDLFSLAKPSGGRGYIIADDLRSAGYPEAHPGADGHMRWSEMHEWCQERFGNRYTWAGSAFFFTSKRDRTLFVLRWS